MAKKRKQPELKSIIAGQLLVRLIGLGEVVGSLAAMFVIAGIMSSVGSVSGIMFIPFFILLCIGWLELLVGVRITRQAAAYESASPGYKAVLSILYVVSTLGVLVGGLAYMNLRR